MKRLKFALTLATCFIPMVAHAGIFGDQGEPAWSRMYRYFETKFASGSSDDVVMIMPTAQDASWDDPSRPIRLMEMNKWADWMPPLGWQYIPNASKTLSSGYGYFLTAAVDSFAASGQSQTVRDAVVNAVQELTFDRQHFNDTVNAADADYSAYLASHPANPLNKSRYFTEQAWDAQINTAQQTLLDAAARFHLISNQIIDPNYKLLEQAITQYSNPHEKIYLPPTRELLHLPDLWQPYYTSTIDGDLDTVLGESTPFDETIDESQQDSTTFESEWKASLSVNFLGFIPVGSGSADEKREEDHMRQNTTKIAVHFDRLATMTIVRGNWYSQNIVDLFAPKLTDDLKKQVFGHNGQLEIIPKAVIVGKGLKISIYADSETRDYIYHHFQADANATFSVGWFSVGPSGSYSETSSHLNVTEFSDHVELQDNSGVPKVVAISATRLGAGMPASVFAANFSPAAFTTAVSAVRSSWKPSDLIAKQKLSPIELQQITSVTGSVK